MLSPLWKTDRNHVNPNIAKNGKAAKTTNAYPNFICQSNPIRNLVVQMGIADLVVETFNMNKRKILN